MDLVDVWPLFRLRLSTPRLELRLLRDDDLPGLVEAARAGIHDPARMPFAQPWTDAPADEMVRGLVQHQWRQRAALASDDWSLNLVVRRDGVPIGMQDLAARRFPVLRTVETGSWLTSSRHGDGLGTEMRAAALTFAFDHLGAEVAVSSAAEWNTASIGVSRRLGYVDNGVSRAAPRGEVESEQHLRLERDAFVRPPWSLRVDGAEEARRALGVEAAPHRRQEALH